jgi:hypothetical protein
MKGGAKMRIEGIGVINKNKALSILTKEGREAVKAGEITIEELGEMYKLQLVQKNSKIGNMGDTFRESFKWIPEDLKKQLTPEQLGNLVDSFYSCYSAGKMAK